MKAIDVSRHETDNTKPLYSQSMAVFSVFCDAFITVSWVETDELDMWGNIPLGGLLGYMAV